MPSGGTPGNINVICTTLKSKLVAGYNSFCHWRYWIRVCLRSFVRRCCLPNLRNHVKFQENLNLNQFEVIQGHRPWCQSEEYMQLSSDFGLSRTVLDIPTHKVRIARFHHPHPCLTPRSGESSRISGWNLRCKKWKYGATVRWKLHNLHQTFLIDPPVWQTDGRTLTTQHYSNNCYVLNAVSCRLYKVRPRFANSPAVKHSS